MRTEREGERGRERGRKGGDSKLERVGGRKEER